MDLDALLRKHVDTQGRVNYRALHADRAALDRVVEALGALSPEALRAWPGHARLAFWINAYNAITLQRIVDHYPIRRGGLVAGLRFPENSVRQIDGVWDKLSSWVAGVEMTLDHIEHEIIRKEFRDPRIHAALVCAAKGCPPLRAEAFTPEALEAQLEDQSRRFFASQHRFQIDRERREIRLSSILKWYGEDFVGVYNADGRFKGHSSEVGAALDYAAKHIDPKDADFLLSDGLKVEFLDYDWSLNEQE